LLIQMEISWDLVKKVKMRANKTLQLTPSRDAPVLFDIPAPRNCVPRTFNTRSG
jgi:hypothetical protein